MANRRRLQELNRRVINIDTNGLDDKLQEDLVDLASRIGKAHFYDSLPSAQLDQWEGEVSRIESQSQLPEQLMAHTSAETSVGKRNVRFNIDIPIDTPEPYTAPHIPEPHPDASYLEYIAQIQNSKPMSRYEDHFNEPNRWKGMIIKRTRKPPNHMDYDQGQTSAYWYRLSHKSEENLPTIPETGERAVYGTYMGQPIHGPTNYLDFYPNWGTVGRQHIWEAPDGRPLPQNEEWYLNSKGYQFLSKIGDGPFGAVWHAISFKKFKDWMGRYMRVDVACKVLNLKDFFSFNLNEGVIRELLKESDLHSRLKHKNIIEWYDVVHIHDPITGFPYCRCLIFMELCDGNLETLLEKQPQQRFNEGQAMDVLDQMSSAIMYLHSHNVCHLDLKIQNVLYVFKDSQIVYKLADFGVSVQFEIGEECLYSDCVGTPIYLPPELLQQNPAPYLAKPVDIYSFGLLFAECLSGVLQFERLVSDVRNMITKTPIPDQQPMTPDLLLLTWGISRRCAEFLFQMTQPDPNDRATIVEILQHLRSSS